MGNAINFWEIQAEVWATGKYLTSVNALNDDDPNKQLTIDDLLTDTNKTLQDTNNNETCFSAVQTTSKNNNLKQSIENLCIESA